jgi:hypothetical protein
LVQKVNAGSDSSGEKLEETKKGDGSSSFKDEIKDDKLTSNCSGKA